MPLRVMTYNIRHALGEDREVNLDRIAYVIQAAQPHIVALQEVDRNWDRSGFQDQSAKLARMLDMHVCFGVNLEEPASSPGTAPSQYGTAILSTSPIDTWSNHPLPKHQGWEPRGVLQAHVELPTFGPVRILNTHLQVGSPGREHEAARQRREQCDTLAAMAATPDLPTILMGDFNARPGDPELSPLLTALGDAWPLAGDGGDGNTIPAEAPTQRIDMILISPALKVADCRVITSDLARIASDHLPVVADLRLR